VGDVTLYTYDAAGNRTSETDASGYTTTYQYDPLNRNSSATLPDGSSTSETFDADGRVTSQTDADGLVTKKVYDALGRVVEIIDPLGGTTKYTYDSEGNPLTITDANNHTTTYSYDAGGHLISETLPTGASESFKYNTDGSLASTTDFDGNTTSYVYDSAGRVSEAISSDGTISYSYSGAGQPTAVTDSRGVTTYDYDSNGRLAKVTNPDGSSFRYTYDSAGDETSMTSAAGTVTYAYDAMHRLGSVTDSNGGVTVYAYTPQGEPATVTYPNQTVNRYVYDSMGRTVSEELEAPDGTVLEKYDYTYDADGLIIGVQGADGRTVAYTYDGDQRLTLEKIHDPVNGDETFAYTYDAVGNRLTKTGSDGSFVAYQYDAGDQLIVAGNATFTYDKNGNMLSETQAGQTTLYSYNSQNELISVHGPQGDSTYTYDADGNRVSSVVNGKTTNYLVDVNSRLPEVVATLDASNTVISSFVYGNSQIISQDVNGVTSYYLTDMQQSVRALTNGSGQVTDTFNYEAFGNLLSRTGTTQAPFLFTGQLLDSDLGLYYMRARYYDPALGRFITADPTAGQSTDPASLNRYIYAQQDPANLFDPTGESPADFLSLFAAPLTPFPFATIIFDVAIDILSLYTQIQSIRLWLSRAQSVNKSLIYAVGGLDFALGSLNLTLGPEASVIGASISAGATVEALWKPFTFQLSFYLSAGIGIGFTIAPFTRTRFSLPTPIPSVFAGLVFGLRSPSDYRGGYINTSFSGPLEFTYIPYVTKVALNAGLVFQPVDAFPIGGVSIFSSVGTGPGSSFGFTFSYGFKPGTSYDLVTSYDYYWQIFVGSHFFAGGEGDRFDLKGLLDKIGQFYSGTLLKATVTADGSQPGEIPTSSMLEANDPRLAPLLAAAEHQWQAALGYLAPVDVSITVAPLQAGELAETRFTASNSRGVPTAATITLSPDAAGLGWFIDPAPNGSGLFGESHGGTSSGASPGSDAYGRYDLFTALLHELGHIEGLIPSNPGFENHVQIAGESEVFVASGIQAPLVDTDQELNPSIYPGDLMSSTLAPGVRELPSALDVQILNIVNGVSASSAVPTTVIDHAVATIASGSPAPSGTPVSTGPSTAKTPATGKKAAHQKPHAGRTQTRHPKVGGDNKKPEPRVLIKPHAKTSLAKAKPTPNGGVAVALSRRGAIVTNNQHHPLKG